MSHAFTIAISDRACNAYKFQRSSSPVLTTITAELPDGIHYSIVGCEARIAICRKTAFDLFSDCGFSRDKFLGDLARLASCESAHLILETSIADIFENPPDGSQMPPKSVYGSVIAWAERYAVIPWFCGDRKMGEKTTYAILDRWYRDHVLGEEASSIFRRARREAKKCLGH